MRDKYCVERGDGLTSCSCRVSMKSLAACMSSVPIPKTTAIIMNRPSSHAIPAAGARKHLATVVRSPARDCCGRRIALAANASGPGPGPMPAPAPPHRNQRVRGCHPERSNWGGTPRGCVGPQRLPSCRDGVAGSGGVQGRAHAPEPPGRPLAGAASTPNPNPNPESPLAGASAAVARSACGRSGGRYRRPRRRTGPAQGTSSASEAVNFKRGFTSAVSAPFYEAVGVMGWGGWFDGTSGWLVVRLGRCCGSPLSTGARVLSTAAVSLYSSRLPPSLLRE
jgi:hypothetical protein